MLYDYVRINIPNGIDESKTKLNVYIELDSTETVINPDAEFFAFPTPFKQQFRIYMEIGIADYYKIVVKNIDEIKSIIVMNYISKWVVIVMNLVLKV